MSVRPIRPAAPATTSPKSLISPPDSVEEVSPQPSACKGSRANWLDHRAAQTRIVAGQRLGAETRRQVAGSSAWRNLVKPEPRVERPIPGKVAIGRERERGKCRACGIGLGGGDERPARALALIRRRDGDLSQCEGPSQSARQGGSRRFHRRSARSSGGHCESRPRVPPARSAVRRRPRHGRCREKGRRPIARWREAPRYRPTASGGRRPSTAPIWRRRSRQ